MKKLTILFDADDTVENLSDCWIAMLNERYGTSVTPEDVHSWDISLAFPTLTKEQVFGVLHDDELWQRITPISGSVEVLQKLYDEGAPALYGDCIQLSHLQNEGGTAFRAVPLPGLGAHHFCLQQANGAW